MIYEQAYIPTDENAEIFLSEEPLKLFEQHIRSQFTRPLEITIDYFGNFLDTYNYSQSQIVDEEDMLTLNTLRDQMFQFMLNIFSKRLGVEFIDFDLKEEDDQLDLLHMAYRFFIINIKHNFASFCLNELKDHRDKYLEMTKPLSEDTIGVTSMRKAGITDEDIKFIISLYDLVDYIVNESTLDIDEFILNCDYETPRLETELMYDWVKENDITGNFYPNYKTLVDSSLKKEIEFIIRREILSKYEGKKLEPKIPENVGETADEQ